MFAAMLPHRRERRRGLDRLVHTERRLAKCWAVACHIDHFRQYEYIYGLTAAEQAFQRVTDALVLSCRDGGQLFTRQARRFVMVVSADSVEEAMELIERHQAAVEDLQIPHQASPFGVLTVSMGLAGIPSGGSDAADRAFKKADAALTNARRAGCSQLVAAAELTLA